MPVPQPPAKLLTGCKDLMVFSDENWGGESHRAVTQAAHKAIIKEYMRLTRIFPASSFATLIAP